MSWSFAWLRSWPEVWSEANLARWQGLVDRPDAHVSPFVTPQLARAWNRAVAGRGRCAPAFLWAEHGSGQTLAWPLVVASGPWRRGLLRELVPVGARLPALGLGTLFDYQDPAVAPAASGASVLAPGFWPAFRTELARREGAWFDRCAFPKLRAACLEPGGAATPAGMAPFVDLGPYPDFASYVARRPERLRNEIRRRRKKLEAEGAVAFRVHGPAEAEAIGRWLPALEAARAQRYPGSSLPAGYLEQVVREGMACGLLCCSSLSLAGREISWDVGFWQQGVYYGYIRSFDASLSPLAPGMVHLARLVDWLIANGGRRLDFLIGDEAYKTKWTDGAAQSLGGMSILSRAPASVARRALTRAVRAFG